MAWSFRNEGTNKVDAKGRVSIPASFRPVIVGGDPEASEDKAAQFVMIYGWMGDNCLNCYTIQEADAIAARLKALPYSKQRKRLEGRLNRQSNYVTVDSVGRIVIPANLRDKFNISKEAYFAGMNDRFEIWDPVTYQAEVLDAEDDFEDEFMDNPLELLNSLPPATLPTAGG